MNSQLVSIILPTYNGSKYIEQSINSCIDQTYNNWELIIVDDCSTDGTATIIDKYVKKDSRIKSVRHQNNRKLPAALNTGFAEATGDFLTWTSDDNLFLPDALTNMVRFLQTNTPTGVVYCDYNVIDETGIILQKETVMPSENLAIGNCIRCCFLYRKKVMQAVGEYSDSLYLSEDYDFFLRASINHQLVPLNKTLYLYRKHDNSLTSKHSELIAAATFKTLENNLPKMKWLCNEMKAKGNIRLASLSAKKHLRKRLFYYLNAIKYSPKIMTKYIFGKICRRFKTIMTGKILEH